MSTAAHIRNKGVDSCHDSSHMFFLTHLSQKPGDAATRPEGAILRGHL